MHHQFAGVIQTQGGDAFSDRQAEAKEYLSG
jgi:hypothetical protein